MKKMETLCDLKSEYAHRFGHMANYRENVWRILCRDYFQQFADPGHVVMDLGAGWGEFIRNIQASRKVAMDMNPDMPERIGDRNVDAILHDCTKTWPLDDGSIDLIFTSNFFEHLPDKDSLRRVLIEAYRCLKPGGKIICIGPNIRLVEGAYWDFWDHFLPLTEKSMVEILQLTGYSIDRCVGGFLPYSMSQGFAPPAFFLKLYLRMPWLWRIVGKQFLVVANKKRSA